MDVKKSVSILLTVTTMAVMSTQVVMAKTYTVPKKVGSVEYGYKKGRINKFKYPEGSVYSIKYKKGKAKLYYNGTYAGMYYGFDKKGRVKCDAYADAFITTYTYKKGKIVKKSEVFVEKPSLFEKEVTTYKYNKKGYVKSCVTKDYKDGKVVSVCKSTIKNTYKKGRLVKFVQQPYHKKNGKWYKKKSFGYKISYKKIKTTPKKYKSLKTMINLQLLPVVLSYYGE